MKIQISILLLLISTSFTLFSMNQENAAASALNAGIKRSSDQAMIITEPEFDTDEQLLHEKIIVRVPRKKRRVDPKPSEHTDPVETVFTNPDMLTNIFHQQQGPDFGRLACVSRACSIAADLSSECTEKLVAHQLLEREDSPIRFVLKQARGKESVCIYDIICNTAKLIATLQAKTSFLDEAIIDFTNQNNYFPSSRKDLPIPPTIEQKLSHDELETVKPVCTLTFDTYQMTEDQIADIVGKYATKLHDHLFVLELVNPLARAETASQITQSLIDKISQYPIAALHVCNEQFPQGLGCLSALTQLRCLILEECDLLENTELPSELCQKLSLLTLLSFIRCGLTSLSPTIGTLKHLRVLEVDSDELISLPDELHNLNKLKVLKIWKTGCLPAETAHCLPDVYGMKKLVIPNMGRDANPIPKSSNPEQLEGLALNDTIEPLKHNPERYRKLQMLELSITYPHFTLSSCIAALPALQALAGTLPDDAIIPYETILHIAQNLEFCSLFGHMIDIEKIRKLAHLYRLIQSNGDLILHNLNEYGELIMQKRCADFMKGCAREIGTIYLLINPAITCKQLRDIIYGGSINNCEQLIRSLLQKHTIQTGFQESQAITKEFGKGNQEFATIFPMIASSLCSDISVYSTVRKNKEPVILNKSQYTFYSFKDLLHNLAFTVNQTMNDIEKGNVITGGQFRKCIWQLKMCSRTPACAKYCAQQLIFLFTNHALRCKDTTNTRILFTYGANIEQFIK